MLGIVIIEIIEPFKKGPYKGTPYDDCDEWYHCREEEQIEAAGFQVAFLLPPGFTIAALRIRIGFL